MSIFLKSPKLLSPLRRLSSFWLLKKMFDSSDLAKEQIQIRKFTKEFLGIPKLYNK